MILDLLNMIVVLSELLMLHILSRSFFTPKEEKKQYHFIFFIVLFFSTFTITEFIGDYPLAKSIILCILFSCWMKATHQVQWGANIFVVVFFQAYVYLADSGVLFLISSTLEKDPTALLASPGSFYLVVFLAKCLESFGILLLQSIIKNRFKPLSVSWCDWIHTAILPIATLLLGILVLFIYKKQPSLSYDLMLCAIVLLATNFFSIILLEKLKERQKYIKDNIHLQEALKKEQASLSLWEDAFKAQRKRTHDFHNHLIVLRGMVEGNSPPSETSRYINNIIQDQSGSKLQISTHRTVVDIIMSQKYTLAEQHNIDFVMQLDDLSAFPLPDDALTVVLANLLDNAIAAARIVTGPQGKHINVKMNVTDKTSYIYIENTTEAPVSIQNNHIVKKSNSNCMHGYGLQNVRLILDRYDADYVFHYSQRNKMFLFSAQFHSQ